MSVRVGVDAVVRVSALGEVDRRIEGRAFHLRENKRRPAHHAVVDAARLAAQACARERISAVLFVEESVPGRERLVRVVIVVHGKPELF